MNSNRSSLRQAITQSAVAIGAILGLSAVPPVAMAITECQVSVDSFFVGDNILYVGFVGGGVGTISQTDPDFKPTFAAITAAVFAQKQLTVRYAENNASCVGPTSYSIIGVWVTAN